jgi:hypothetical protein
MSKVWDPRALHWYVKESGYKLGKNAYGDELLSKRARRIRYSLIVRNRYHDSRHGWNGRERPAGAPSMESKKDPYTRGYTM